MIPEQLAKDLKAFRPTFEAAKALLTGRQYVEFPHYGALTRLAQFGRRGYDNSGMTYEQREFVRKADSDFTRIIHRNPGLSRVIRLDSEYIFTYAPQP